MLSVEGCPIAFFVKGRLIVLSMVVFQPSSLIVKDTRTLSHTLNFPKNSVSFLVACCHFFLEFGTNLLRASFRLFGKKIYGCFNFFDTSFTTMPVTTLIFSFNTVFKNSKIFFFVNEIASVLSRFSVESLKITLIEELSLPISYKQYYKRENYMKNCRNCTLE